MNKYSYCFNNPLKYNDPTGEWPSFGKLFKKIGNAVKKAAQAVVNVVKENIDVVQTVLDAAGMIPVVGEVFDAVNGVIYAARGDAVNAALSFSACVPVAGSIATGVKWGKKGVDAVRSAIKVGDKVGDVSRAGWKLGDPITNITKAGNEPSWTTVRNRYWKNETLNNPGGYSDYNLSRMQRGLAPLDKTGTSIQLHHIEGRGIKNPHNISNLQPLTYWQHWLIHYGPK